MPRNSVLQPCTCEKMSDFELKPGPKGIPGPLLLVILDGVGIYRGAKDGYPGNALDLANAPTLKGLMQNAPIRTQLKAHGKAVGLPSNSDMGNSEVGHNAMGAGRVFAQGAKLVNDAISSGSLFEGPAWKQLIGSKDEPGFALEAGTGRAVHFIGLLSDGNVHSHIDQLLALIDRCAAEGVQRVCVHPLLDGRDVEKASALKYIDKLEETLKACDPSGKNYLIASGGGRMKITMDRYEADWNMVELGWKTHVQGKGRMFSTATEAIETMRLESKAQGVKLIDQDVSPFVISTPTGEPIAPIKDDDCVIFFNFRGDRAIEISRAFTEEFFTPFPRIPDVKVHYAGMMEYDGDLHIPPDYLVEPPAIDRTMSEYLARNGITQFAISETQKFGHVTYFWNGNNSEKFSDEFETWVEIPSDNVPFEETPRMKADEITDTIIEKAMCSGNFKFIRVNYPNGDMVGHTGHLHAAVAAVEALDENLERLVKAAEDVGATIVITADHGNCDQMYEEDKEILTIKHSVGGSMMVKTSHTLSPVPFLVLGKDADRFVLNEQVKDPGLGNVAASLLTLLGYQPPDDYLPSIVVPT